MRSLEWLQMAAERSKELPDQHLDWKWIRFGDDMVVFAVSEHPPKLAGKDRPLEDVVLGKPY